MDKLAERNGVCISPVASDVDVQELFMCLFAILEKEMATHSSILAWRIPWMEERGGLQSMGSQRVRRD